MKLICGLLLPVLAAVAFQGCNDPLGEKADERRREQKMLDERKEEERQRETLASAMGTAVHEKRKLIEASIGDRESEVAILRADLDAFARAVTEAMDVKSDSAQTPKYGLKVFNAMKSDVVDALAVKYLGTGFSVVREEFLSSLKDVRADELRYRKALEAADDDHAQSAIKSRDWIDAEQGQRDKEIARLKKEIASLESQWNAARTEVRNLTRHSLVGSARHERERVDKIEAVESRASDIQQEIYRKRRQLDSLTSPDRMVDSVNHAATRAQGAQWMSHKLHESRLYNIRREMKPSKTVLDVVGEYEAKTLGRLRTVISSRLDAAEKALAVDKEKNTALRNIELSIPISKLSELQRLREKLIAL